jgi:uncharacterized protein DUF6011
MSNTEAQTAECRRCHRILRSAASVQAGAGRWCRAKERAAQTVAILKGFTEAQIEKARQLLTDGALIPTARPGVFRAVSSKGDTSYLAHSATCSCPGGLRSRSACYHSLAVRIVLASGKTA